MAFVRHLGLVSIPAGVLGDGANPVGALIKVNGTFYGEAPFGRSPR